MSVKVTMNGQALEAILRGTAGNVRADLDARGRRIAMAAGHGHEIDRWVGAHRYRVTVRSKRPVVVTRSPLLRALDAGR